MLPSTESLDHLYVWNGAQDLFEYLVGNAKSYTELTLYQFQKLSKVKELFKAASGGNINNANNLLKADFDIIYKNVLRKHE